MRIWLYCEVIIWASQMEKVEEQENVFLDPNNIGSSFPREIVIHWIKIISQISRDGQEQKMRRYHKILDKRSDLWINIWYFCWTQFLEYGWWRHAPFSSSSAEILLCILPWRIFSFRICSMELPMAHTSGDNIFCGSWHHMFIYCSQNKEIILWKEWYSLFFSVYCSFWSFQELQERKVLLKYI